MSAAEVFLPILVVIIGFAALSWFIYRLVNHINSYNVAAGRITFKQFRTLYEIDEYPWFLNDNDVDYFDSHKGRIYLRFSFLDEIRYRRWRRCKDRLKERNEKNKNFQIVLNAMQKTIEEYQERNSLQ